MTASPTGLLLWRPSRCSQAQLVIRLRTNKSGRCLEEGQHQSKRQEWDSMLRSTSVKISGPLQTSSLPMPSREVPEVLLQESLVRTFLVVQCWGKGVYVKVHDTSASSAFGSAHKALFSFCWEKECHLHKLSFATENLNLKILHNWNIFKHTCQAAHCKL